MENPLGITRCIRICMTSRDSSKEHHYLEPSGTFNLMGLVVAYMSIVLEYHLLDAHFHFNNTRHRRYYKLLSLSLPLSLSLHLLVSHLRGTCEVVEGMCRINGGICRVTVNRDLI